MNDIFDFKRLGALFVYDWATTWKMYVIYFSLIMGSAVMANVVDVLDFPVITSLIGSLGVLVFIIGLLYIPSIAFSNMSTKGRRINFLMLPASNLEKFTVRVVNYAILPIFVAFLAVFLLDRISFVFDNNPGNILFHICQEIMKCDDKYGVLILIKVIFAIFVLLLCQMSFMVLGASIFRKKVLIKTIAVSFGISIIFSFFDIDLSIQMNDKLFYDDFLTWGIVTHLVLTAIYFSVSYFLFKRKQLKF
jgi:hypothetical protein